MQQPWRGTWVSGKSNKYLINSSSLLCLVLTVTFSQISLIDPEVKELWPENYPNTFRVVTYTFMSNKQDISHSHIDTTLSFPHSYSVPSLKSFFYDTCKQVPVSVFQILAFACTPLNPTWLFLVLKRGDLVFPIMAQELKCYDDKNCEQAPI